MKPANDNDARSDHLTLAVILLAAQPLSIEQDAPITVPFERLQMLFDNVIITCRQWLQELEADHG